MKTATKNVKRPAPKKAAKRAPAASRTLPLIDPRIAERAKAVDAALARLAGKAPEAARKEAPKAEAKPAAKAQPKKARKMGALDAAALVLAEAGKPMRATELVSEMAKRGLWTSPGGKTPEATLYSAMIREIGAKGAASRFARAGKGEFASTQKGGA